MTGIVFLLSCSTDQTWIYVRKNCICNGLQTHTGALTLPTLQHHYSRSELNLVATFTLYHCCEMPLYSKRQPPMLHHCLEHVVATEGREGLVQIRTSELHPGCRRGCSNSAQKKAAVGVRFLACVRLALSINLRH